MTWIKPKLTLCYVLPLLLLASCATPASRSELTPLYSGQASAQITIGVVDSRPYVVSGDKEPWFEGVIRGAFGIPHTFNRPKSPPDESFADRIAGMLKRTFTDAGSQVTVVELAPGLSWQGAVDELRPNTRDVALLVYIHDSKFDAGGFAFDYPYHFQLNVLDSEGNVLGEARLQGQDAHAPSDKYNVWDMYGVVYKSKFEQLLAKPEIQLALTNASRSALVK